MGARRRLVALALLSLPLGGCATVGPVGLRHPETGGVAGCEGYWAWSLDWRKAQGEQARQDRCIQEYERQGYVRVW
jgi:hypothetical protein